MHACACVQSLGRATFGSAHAALAFMLLLEQFYCPLPAPMRMDGDRQRTSIFFDACCWRMSQTSTLDRSSACSLALSHACLPLYRAARPALRHLAACCCDAACVWPSGHACMSLVRHGLDLLTPPLSPSHHHMPGCACGRGWPAWTAHQIFHHPSCTKMPACGVQGRASASAHMVPCSHCAKPLSK